MLLIRAGARTPASLLALRRMHPCRFGRKAVSPTVCPASSVRCNSTSGAADSVTPDSSSSNGSTKPEPGSSKAASDPSATAPRLSVSKRRLKSHRGKTFGKAGSGTDSSSKIYVPTIPESFLSTNHYSAASIPSDLSSLRYHVHDGVKLELLNTMASCLLSPSQPNTHHLRMPARHNNIILSSPSLGSNRLLKDLVLSSAKRLGADVVTIDMQDLMELTADMFNGKNQSNPWPMDHLFRGFNPFVSAPIPVEYMDDSDDDADDYQEDTEGGADSEEQEPGSHGTSVFLDSAIFAGRSRQGRHTSPSATTLLKENLEKFWTALLLAKPAPRPLSEKSSPKILYFQDIADVIHTSFGSTLLPSLTNAVTTLRKAGHNIIIVTGHSPSLLTSDIHDDDEESAGHPSGLNNSTMISTDSEKANSLVTILQKLRSPTASGHGSSALPPNSLSSLMYDNFPGPIQTFHHISIPPFLPVPEAAKTDAALLADEILQQRQALENAELMKKDKADTIRGINQRNLEAVLRFRGGVSSSPESTTNLFGALKGIETEVWGFGKVYRIISNALGAFYLDPAYTSGSTTALTSKHVQSAMETLTANTKLRKMLANSDWSGAKKRQKQLVRPEDCNRYERKLLRSIVDPDKIRTTFRNTITPVETVHALQTMITLPLVRPELFSSGLLQNEFLSGLLLFGPPGTGKTLLAKAVAKESGARMLEIKASDIFDMYVGEGEKNVSAVFSLARKLSPCVIFLDEVDSIFRARGSSGGAGGSGGGNSSQREILNQFMVEWDGLRSSGRNNGIVVMASTNRPFELDDAVLRRLPRRILVDLPSEEARERILNVYLGQEKVEEGFDIKALAQKTKFFSGSDLKNLCVAAALASVREDIEKEVRALQSPESGTIQPVDADNKEKVLDLSPLWSHRDATKYPSPSTRVIAGRHFEKALQQITPSCSEDMSSLTELRKWDSQYGDGGKSRRKTIKGLGFDVEATPLLNRLK